MENKKSFKIGALLALLVAFGACKGNSNLIRPGDPINVAYQKAQNLFEKEKYSAAADAFETITRIGRGTNFAKDAQYYLAESYYRNRSFLLAASEFDRYVGFYPTDERREEVDFKTAKCYYEQSPRYELDQSDTIRAIEAFQLFNNRYPGSERVLESAGYIDEMRNKLARKYYEAADFYTRIREYESAAIYFGVTIDQFPESEYAELALVRQIRTYVEYADNSVPEKQKERYEKAVEGYQKFIQLFPRSNERANVEALNDKSLAAIAKIDRESATQN